ncbi:hypothetical protein MAR_031932 [Mya arenaria]|uniref:Uncharacterized protein n=1 Tax=Mya arenaria TaxID=6604 RepID=A0ABY7F583_MYAAR|nr:hypothetical protein MAR_031932 [Mya arenaria]
MYRQYKANEMAGKLKIGVVISSTREGRIGERITTFVKNAILKDHEVVVFGRLGGSRAAVQLRVFTGGMGMMAVPTGTSIPLAHQALDESGKPKDDTLSKELDAVIRVSLLYGPASDTGQAVIHFSQ